MNDSFKQWAPCIFLVCFALSYIAFILYPHLLSCTYWIWMKQLSENQRYKRNTHIKERLLFSFSSFPFSFSPVRCRFYSQLWQLINRGLVQSCAFSKVTSSYCISLKIINRSLFSLSISLQGLLSFLLSSASDTFRATWEPI